MKKLWLTYAWKDNDDQQINFVIDALKAKDLKVGFDRAQLVPGQRLWQNLDKAISDPALSDAWAIYVTKNSLSSEPCLEELTYALDRALRTRGQQFPLIGIFPEHIDRSMIPSAIATRVYVHLSDPDWAQQVADGVAKRAPKVDTNVPPFVADTHTRDGKVVLELRPRAGRWYPFIVVVPKAERHLMRQVTHGPSKYPPIGVTITRSNEVAVDHRDGRSWTGIRLHDAIDHLTSAYVELSAIPSQLLFGAEKDGMHQLRRQSP